MNRRKFVVNTCLYSTAVVASPLISDKGFALNIFNSGLKTLSADNYLKKVSIPSFLQSYLDTLIGDEITSYSNDAFRYGDNYILEVKEDGLIYDRPKLLFYTADIDHMIVDEEDTDVLNHFINDFLIGLKEQECKLDPTQFLFPYHIYNNESAVFSFYNKCSNQVKLMKRGDHRHIFIY